MKNKLIWLFAAALVVSGAGCSWFSKNIPKLPSITPAGPKPADFSGVDSAEAAKRVNFVPGSQMEIRQTYLGLGAKSADALAGDDKEGVRIVTIERFAPMNYANLSWKLNSRVQTEASAQAQADYEKQMADLPVGQGTKPTPPDTVTELQAVAGGLSDIDLKQSHGLYPPAYWPSQKSDARQTSGIWLSEDAFDELIESHQTTLILGFLDERLYGALKAASDFSDAIRVLQGQADVASKRADLDWATADEDYADWTLKINGQDVTVQVIKLRNWYGEVVVLNNPQNPLVLKMTFSPSTTAVTGPISGDALLPSLLGYEVTSLDNVQ